MFFLFLCVDAWSVSSVPLKKLRLLENAQFIRDTLSRDGVFFITDIPHFEQASEDAFTAFEKCNASTLAATNTQSVYKPFTVPSMPDVACDMHAAHTFRLLMRQTGIDVANACGSTAVDLMHNGSHREQFRHYSRSDHLAVHTDAGVLLGIAQ